MTILKVVQDVTEVVGVLQPTSIFASIAQNRTMQEMLALANEMAQRIAYDTRDWTALKTSATFVGDGQWVPPQPDPLAVWTGTSAFTLPANYKRMLLTANVRISTYPNTPALFVPDYDDWIMRRMRNWFYPRGEWTIVGGKMLLWPIMAGPIAQIPGPPIIPAVPAVTATFPYLDKNCVALSGGGNGAEFMADTDSFRLDERLLKLGMIWQWKAQKGSPYQEDMATYGDALTTVMGKDSPAPIIIGRLPISAAVKTAYPWPVPT